MIDAPEATLCRISFGTASTDKDIFTIVSPSQIRRSFANSRRDLMSKSRYLNDGQVGIIWKRVAEAEKHLEGRLQMGSTRRGYYCT